MLQEDDIKEWVSATTRCDDAPNNEIENDEPVIVCIKNRKHITDDMINRPYKYILVLMLPRCSICGGMDHNARRHKKKM